ncbi:ATP-grasp domain-containing protein (plasmid) [Streptomyces sp. HUAS TT11]|uniref:ATP-grasp domain-containing protein n=1 Tax=Streptomyces sp. HUAS TT11 TaxID=3447508 RepID=UPI003F656563
MPHHYLVIHRWTDRYADYAAYLDHRVHDVTYVTTSQGAASLPAEAAAVSLVSSTEDGKEVRTAVSALVGRFGRPTRIVALHEVDLDIAAELRGELGIPGERLAELRPFRDKLAMSRRLVEAGVPTPATEPAPDHAAVHAFADRYGWPVLVKPVRGTASAGVTPIDSPEQLAAYDFQPDVPMLVQPYLPHEILHVDGIATGSGLGAWRASRYLSTCLDYTSGTALGSVELDDPGLLRVIEEFTTRVVTAFSERPWVFHIELFLSSADGVPRLQVLEVGARPGGAEVPFVWQEVHGVDLMAAAFAVQTGRPLPPEAVAPPSASGAERGGWLLVPTPAARPCRVTSAGGHPTPEEGGPYAARVPVPGETLPVLAGYEHSGARFRFRGASTSEVEAAVRRTSAAFDYRCASVDPADPDLLVLVGNGDRAYREYAFASLAEHTRVHLVSESAPSWQAAYTTDHSVVEPGDADALSAAVAAAAASTGGRVGVMTWNEVLLEATARTADRLRLPHMSPAAARACRDKLTTRGLLRAAGLPAVRHAHVHDVDEALREATGIGYPVVVKPRSLAGSVGVVVAHDREELRTAYDVAAGAAFPGLDQLEGVLLEEYLEGPEISVDSVVRDGAVEPLSVARKRLGFPPFFEEVGHLVAPWRHEPWADGVIALVSDAHRALGVTTGVTHAEVRLTAAGPRLIELNGRLGGDFIPYLGHLATGVELTTVAADVALGRSPDTRATRGRCAEVRFLYPAVDSVVRSLDLTAAAQVPGVSRAVRLAEPGRRLLLPPNGAVPRLAALVVTGATPEECRQTLDRAEALVRYEAEPLATATGAHAPKGGKAA